MRFIFLHVVNHHWVKPFSIVGTVVILFLGKSLLYADFLSVIPPSPIFVGCILELTFIPLLEYLRKNALSHWTWTWRCQRYHCKRLGGSKTVQPCILGGLHIDPHCWEGSTGMWSWAIFGPSIVLHLYSSHLIKTAEKHEVIL